MRATLVSMKRIPILSAFAVLIFAVPSAVWAATASATEAYPSASVPPGVRVSFIVTGSGFSSHPTYKVVDSFPGGVTTVNIDAAGNLAWTPNKDDIGSHGITVTLTDSEGHSASASRTITVISAATVTAAAPSPSDAVAIGTPVSIALTSGGLFSPTFTVRDSVTSSSVSNGKVNASGVFTWTPLQQDVGVHTLTFTGEDAYGTKASAAKEITVLPPPSVSIAHLPQGASVPAESELRFDIVAEGFVKPSYTVSDDAGPTRSPITVSSSGGVAWTPVADEFGRHSLRVSAHDGVRSATTTVTVNVLAPAPVAATPASAPASSGPTPASVWQAPTLASTSSPVAKAKALVQTSKHAPTHASATTTSSAGPAAPDAIERAYATVPRDVPLPITPDATTTIETRSLLSLADHVWISIGTFFDRLLRRFGL